MTTEVKAPIELEAVNILIELRVKNAASDDDVEAVLAEARKLDEKLELVYEGVSEYLDNRLKGKVTGDYTINHPVWRAR